MPKGDNFLIFLAYLQSCP